jgi:hypothetical protein
MLKPFVKHACDVKSGKFVLYNRLRFVASAFVTLAIGLGLWLSYEFTKTEYNIMESNFFLVAGLCVAGYFAMNIAYFTARPRYKHVLTNENHGLLRRMVFTVCVIASALSINVLAGLSAVNVTDYLVYMIVPCILGSLFLVVGLVIHSLKRVPVFLT